MCACVCVCVRACVRVWGGAVRVRRRWGGWRGDEGGGGGQPGWLPKADQGADEKDQEDAVRNTGYD